MVALAHTRRVRVLIADDHRLVAAAAQRALERSGAFEVVATATRGSEVVPKVGQLRPDVLLLDVSMPGIDGIGCLERVCKRWPELRVVMLSASAADDVVDAAGGRGACGFIVEGLEGAKLPSAILGALASDDFRVYGNEREESNGKKTARLTEREISMLAGVARGLSNKAIRRELWISEQTVKFHLTNIYQKLGVRNRTQAIRYAYENGFLQAT